MTNARLPGVHPDDLLAMVGGGELITPDNLKELGQLAKERSDGFLQHAIGIMTAQRARRVRQLRRQATWRTVADICHRTWVDADWSPPSNQLAGLAICKVAARFLGQDPNMEPWN